MFYEGPSVRGHHWCVESVHASFRERVAPSLCYTRGPLEVRQTAIPWGSRPGREAPAVVANSSGMHFQDRSCRCIRCTRAGWSRC